jgi:hypothetical protein
MEAKPLAACDPVAQQPVRPNKISAETQCDLNNYQIDYFVILIGMSIRKGTSEVEKVLSWQKLI